MPAALTMLFDSSERPIYAVDARRHVIYCNSALAAWLGVEAGRIVGRSVEYHSEPAADGGEKAGAAAPLTDLCPPPRALAGERFEGTIGRFGRDGRLVHRRAEFLPLTGVGASASGVLVLLDVRHVAAGTGGQSL
jgi:PAS domain-containing protein